MLVMSQQLHGEAVEAESTAEHPREQGPRVSERRDCGLGLWEAKSRAGPAAMVRIPIQK